MKNKSLIQSVAGLSKGIFTTMEDFLLFYFLMLEKQIGSPKTSYSVWKAYYEAEEELKAYKSETFRAGFYRTKNKKFIKVEKENKQLTIEITKAGRKRLDTILPNYDQKRLWDKKLYLVTYDISEKRKSDRDKLRSLIKQLGMGMLQESVWITPYNPKEILRQFLHDHYLTGSVIISDLGEDGAIGEEDVKSLVCKMYKLDKLNQRYEDFLLNVNQDKNNPWLRLEYLSILKDDPQLPFALLPVWWKGEEANRLYAQKFLK